MNDQIPDVQIPSKAVSDQADLKEPVGALLRGLNLLPDKTALDAAGGVGAAFAGPPQSVALIEAGATAVAKWWAAGLGAVVLAAWATVPAWWSGQTGGVHATVVGGVALLSSAVALAVAYLLASDVRGRALASAATIEARARVAREMIQAAQAVYEKPPAPSEVQLVPLPAGIKVTYADAEPVGNERNWLALAIERQADGKLKYLVVKGKDKKVVDADKLDFG
jgi:hypothetical protein